MGRPDFRIPEVDFVRHPGDGPVPGYPDDLDFHTPVDVHDVAGHEYETFAHLGVVERRQHQGTFDPHRAAAPGTGIREFFQIGGFKIVAPAFAGYPHDFCQSRELHVHGCPVEYLAGIGIDGCRQNGAGNGTFFVVEEPLFFQFR